MGVFINVGKYRFQCALNSDFVDKSGVLEFLNKSIDTEKSFMCVSRPRRFGKSIIASMIQCYYDRSIDSKSMFEGLEIASKPSYLTYLNKYPVISIDLNFFCSVKEPDLIAYIQEQVVKDLKVAYPFLKEKRYIHGALTEINQKTGDRFIFMIDEWDRLVRDVDTKLQNDYLNFLRSLFKSANAKDIFALVYMTGILPIIKFETQSALNNFKEYSVVDPVFTAPYYGFTKEEVKVLCDKFDMDFERTKQAYDSYIFGSARSMFNPNSVMENADRKTYASFWSRTASFSLVNRFITIDADNVRKYILRMLNGDKVAVDVTNFRNDMKNIETCDDVLTLLIHLGYLSYDPENGTARIPNTEVLTEFSNIVRSANWGNISEAVAKSSKLVQDTIDMDSDAIAKAFDEYRFEATSILTSNNEDSMASAIRYAYFSAVSHYKVVREMPAGKGFADMVFLPLRKSSRPAILVEFKYDKSADSAISQIHNKNYAGVLKGLAERVILVGINYNTKLSKHEVVMEEMERV